MEIEEEGEEMQMDEVPPEMLRVVGYTPIPVWSEKVVSQSKDNTAEGEMEVEEQPAESLPLPERRLLVSSWLPLM